MAQRKAKTPSKDAITLLKEDHKKVKGLLSELEKTTDRSGARRKALLRKIETEIKVHTTIEEKIFYPAYHKAAETKEQDKLYFEALEEHSVVDMVLPKLKATRVDAEEFPARAKVLKDLIEHHAEEEEKEMFPKARTILGAAKLRELGGRMDARKKTLMARRRG